MLHIQDMGEYYLDNKNDLWQMVGYCPKPTVIMMKVLTKEMNYIIPDCPDAERFNKLVKENKKASIGEDNNEH